MPHTDYFSRDVMVQEVARWLAFHDTAAALFATLPPEQQEQIRRDGQPSIVPLSALVGCKPEARELARSIFQELHRSLSHPGLRVEPKTETEGAGVAGGDRDWAAEVEHLEEKVTALECQRDELLRTLRAISAAASVGQEALVEGK